MNELLTLSVIQLGCLKGSLILKGAGQKRCLPLCLGLFKCLFSLLDSLAGSP